MKSVTLAQPVTTCTNFDAQIYTVVSVSKGEAQLVYLNRDNTIVSGGKVPVSSLREPTKEQFQYNRQLRARIEEQAEIDALTRQGEALVKLLSLKVNKLGRVDTPIGDKTMVGLARTISRIINNETKFIDLLTKEDA